MVLGPVESYFTHFLLQSFAAQAGKENIFFSFALAFRHRNRQTRHVFRNVFTDITNRIHSKLPKIKVLNQRLFNRKVNSLFGASFLVTCLLPAFFFHRE